MFKGVDKDKNNIQLQKLNMDEVKGNGGGTGITNSDEGDTDEVFYSDETATKGIGDDKEEIAPLRKTRKDYMRNTACRPLRYFLVSNNFIVIVSPSCAVTPHSYALENINIYKCCSCTL